MEKLQSALFRFYKGHRRYLMVEKVLVTGGAGFIGSHIVGALLKQGSHVRILDSFITGKRDNLKEVENDIELIEGDVRDLECAKKSARGCQWIFHQAALRSVPKSVDNPALTNDINISGTLTALIAAREENVERFVYASSSSVYGETDVVPEKEDAAPNPVSPYAVSKLAGEHYCRAFSCIHGLYTISLRYFNVFGPRQDPESLYSAVVPKFIQQAMRGEPYEIHGDGLQSRDFTYISNVVDANLAAARSSGIGGEYFNVACGTTTSVMAIAESVSRLMNKPFLKNHTPKRVGDVRITHADVSKAKKLMHYGAKINLEIGLKETIDFFLKNPHRL